VNVQLDWQVADDDDNWEPIAQMSAARRLRLPGWVWHMPAAALVLLVVGAAIGVRYRYCRALQRATAQIQDVVDLEARALAQGDVGRYLAQQDASLPEWVARQAARVGQKCTEVTAAGPVPDALSAGVCPLSAPVWVARVDLRDDVAWVEVVQPQAALRQVRFYRQTRQGWLHTAPHARFWQDPVEWVLGRVHVRAARRDLSVIEPTVAHVVAIVEDTCATFDCPRDVRLELRFSHHDVPPRLSGTMLTLASPWLAGIPVDGSLDEGYARDLTYWVVYGLASQMIRANYDDPGKPDAADPPDVAHEEMLRACLTLYSRGGQHSADALHAMRDACRSPEFVAQ
jgi:hypothetical protein